MRISQCLCDRNLLIVAKLRRWLKAVSQRKFSCLFIDRVLAESVATINSVPA